MSDKTINWRNIGIRRDRRFESLIVLLSAGEKTIFKHLKDIMVFAAVVGYSSKSRRSINGGDSISIILDTYASDNKDSFVYLLALMTNKNGVCLKDENLSESVKIFEEYCNGGLYIIESWVEAKPADDVVDVILNNIYDKLIETEGRASKVKNSDLELPGL